MSTDEENEGWREIEVSKGRIRIGFGVLLAVVAGAIGYPTISMVAPARHDAFTGTQGRILERRIETLESQMVRVKLNSHYHDRRVQE